MTLAELDAEKGEKVMKGENGEKNKEEKFTSPSSSTAKPGGKFNQLNLKAQS